MTAMAAAAVEQERHYGGYGTGGGWLGDGHGKGS